MHRRLFNEIQRIKRRILALEKGASNLLFTINDLTSETRYHGSISVAGLTTNSEVSESHLVFLDTDKEWKRAVADLPSTGSSEMIGIALTATPHTDGVLTDGVYKLDTSYVSGTAGAGTFTVGAQVYIHPITSGSFTTTIPTGSGEIVRVVGHSIDSDTVYFNPSPDFIEI